ncbi:MAG TPA: aminopeptidase P family protein [Micromonosporaceae bacterium]|jgi:Xaa-Pro aminopeptidase|nr:aminopeptidase P family protein [Micromonosporaceae bacterium]
MTSQPTEPGTPTTTGAQAHDPDYPERLLDFMRTGWTDATLDVTPSAAAPNYAARRAAVSAAFAGLTVVIPSGHERVRANDTYYPFRPGSDLYYLTGEHDPEAVLVLQPTGSSGHDATLYVRPRSPRDTDEFFRDRGYGELWIGRRHTLGEKSAELGVATAPLSELPDVLANCAPARTRTVRGVDATVDAAVALYGDGAGDRELASTLAELRLPKDPWEIAQLQDAIDATVRGFEDVARVLPSDRPVAERLLDGVFGLRARHDGNTVGYSAIVGGGAHATILHWTRNTGHTRPGDLLLMDMGVENRELYTADVTRTLPVNGTFSALQREVYDIVYASQQAGIDLIKPGVEFKDIHETCMRVLAGGLSDLGLLPVGVDEAMDPESQVYRRWTLHGFGHMLGLDVHDCANARHETYRGGAIGENYVLTVEPGLYFQPEDDLVPAELRGIGIRIEDDVLVTSAGAQVMSDGLPRHPADVESWLAAQRAAGPRLPG